MPSSGPIYRDFSSSVQKYNNSFSLEKAVSIELMSIHVEYSKRHIAVLRLGPFASWEFKFLQFLANVHATTVRRRNQYAVDAITIWSFFIFIFP